MKRSEQTPGTGGHQAGQDRDGMLVAARVFSNYVPLPARREPDERAAEASLHGAGVLVFGDQPQQQIQLRTGQAAYVAGSATARPAEELVDEAMSGHKGSYQKGTTMTTKIACSACHAVFAAGATTCPSCGLQLTAQAIPVKPIARRFPVWPIILGAIAIVIIAVSLADRAQQSTDDSAKASFIAAIAAGQLNSPEAFEARCGMPASTHAGKKGTDLRYSTHWTDLEWVVSFAATAPKFEMEHIDYKENGKADIWRDTRSAADFFSQGTCH